jgi:hypothetical protein
MPRYKPVERHSLMLAVDLDEQIVPGSFAFSITKAWRLIFWASGTAPSANGSLSRSVA